MFSVRNFSNAIRSLLLSFNSRAQPSPSSNTAATTSAASPSSQPGPISPTPSDRPTLPFNPFDIESGTKNVDPRPTADEEQPDWKRTGKVVQTVGLGAVGVSVTLIVNMPASANTQPALYTAYLSVVGLALFTGMGLSFFSILKNGSPKVGWVQKRLIFFTLFFVALACILCLHLALPLAHVLIGMAAIGVVVGLIVIYLTLCNRPDRRQHDTGTER